MIARKAALAVTVAAMGVVMLVAASLVGGVTPSRAAAGSPAGQGAATTSTTVDAVAVTVSNPSRAARNLETTTLALSELQKIAPALEAKKAVIVDASGSPVLSQLLDMDGDGVPEQLAFQSLLGAGEARAFVVRPGDRPPSTRDDFKSYGRFVRERYDDFAWENDRVAHRMYGPALETWKAEPLVSSGVDVWVKRTRKLVINDWYMTDNYHRDNGEGADFYSVGKSRGCGGLGVWAGDKLYVSRNFVKSRVLANGPLRLVFELEYAPWEAGGKMVSETKRVTLDAGTNFNRFESSFRVEGGAIPSDPSMMLGIGIARHEGGVLQVDKPSGQKARWMATWEPLKNGSGNLGCALIGSAALFVDRRSGDLDHLMIVKARPGAVIEYQVGSAWDRGGGVPDVAAWTKIVEGLARAAGEPLRVSMQLRKVPVAASTSASAGDPASRGGGLTLAGGGTAGGGGGGVAGAGAGAGSAAATPVEGRWSARTCDSVMGDGPTLTDKWAYDAGLVLQGCLRTWGATGNRKYFSFVKRSVDHLISAEGRINGYRIEDYNLDNINMGKLLFPLLEEAGDAGDKERYRKALYLLRSQLETQPRTSDGAFWHKLIYPRQMWLDGVYMASPFLAQFGVVFHEPELIDEAAHQVLLAEKHMREPRSGLLYHGWDESKEQRWANAKTGTSPQFWGRAMGWYAMAVVDVLEQMPANHQQREAVMGVLRRLATAVALVQDKTTGVWWQILDAPLRGKNYEEASASAMFVYALGKGVKKGWLDARRFGPVVSRGYQGIINTFVEAGPGGRVNVKNICKVAGLGGNPYRDGSFDYYTSTEIATNDFKGVGAFILASAVNE